jgi:hypothetical protein
MRFSPDLRLSSPVGTVSNWGLLQVAPTDLNIPILDQLAPAQLPLSDALEPGPLEIVRLDAPLVGRPLQKGGVGKCSQRGTQQQICSLGPQRLGVLRDE